MGKFESQNLSLCLFSDVSPCFCFMFHEICIWIRNFFIFSLFITENRYIANRIAFIKIDHECIRKHYMENWTFSWYTFETNMGCNYWDRNLPVNFFLYRFERIISTINFKGSKLKCNIISWSYHHYSLRSLLTHYIVCLYCISYGNGTTNIWIFCSHWWLLSSNHFFNVIQCIHT